MGNFTNELKEYQNIPRELIFDKTISDRARFVFCFMAAKPDDWDFYLSNMAKEIGYSVETLRKYIKELVDRGWLIKGEQERQDGNLFGAVSYTLRANIPNSSDTENFRHGKNTTQTYIEYNIKENNIKENKDKSLFKKEKNVEVWRTDFNAYLDVVNKAKHDILNDDEFYQKMMVYYPYSDYDKTIDKEVSMFWGTEAGWNNKKSKKRGNIDMLLTLKNNYPKNIVYRDRNQNVRVRLESEKLDVDDISTNNKWQY